MARNGYRGNRSAVSQETSPMKIPWGRDMRPLLGLPHWDGKIVLAAIFTLGYFWVIWILVGPDRTELSETQKQIATIALAALGPQLGQIYGSIFRHTLSDERDAERRNDALKTAIETPSVVDPGSSPTALAKRVEAGARRGTREGVEEALDVPSVDPAAVMRDLPWNRP